MASRSGARRSGERLITSGIASAFSPLSDGSSTIPNELELELLRSVLRPLVFDVESRPPGDQNAFPRHLNGEGAAALDDAGEATKLSGELLTRIRPLQISWASR